MNGIHCLLAAMLLVSAWGDATLTDYEDYDDYDDDDLSAVNATSNGTLALLAPLVNVTRDPGKTAKFACHVHNSDPNGTRVNFLWKINEVQVRRDSRMKFRQVKEKDGNWRSVLTIRKLEFFDQGFVECIASNGMDRIRANCSLIVTPEAPKWGSTAISALNFGNSDGGDLTTFLPSAEGRALGGASEPHKAKTFSVPITFDLDSSGRLTDNSESEGVVYNGSEPFCQLYKGQVCKTFLAQKYVFVQPPFTQEDVENKLFNAFSVITRSNDISSSCSKFAQPSICFSAFPLCLDHRVVDQYQHRHRQEFRLIGNESRRKFRNIRKQLTNSLRRVCRDECILLETELCSKEYSIAKRHPVIGQIMELEVCESLPVEMDPSSSHCLSLGVGDFKGNKDEQCYWDAGKLYRGVRNTTVTGEQCIKWSHQFHLLPSDYPELAGHNYCRNPGEAEAAPFCYVENSRTELCGVPKCGELALDVWVDAPPPSLTLRFSVYVFGSYVVGVLLVITILVSLLFGYCYCRRRGKVARSLQHELPQANKNIYGNAGPSSPIELNSLLPPGGVGGAQRSHAHSKLGYQSLPQYTYKEVRFIKELGEGAFGKVYQGELRAKAGKVFVAVKSLKENASAKTQADFQREIELISELKHPNIICLLGVVVKQEPMCMLFEYMSEGDLHEFLIANSPENGQSLADEQFLDIAVQIAHGMEYLAENHYVHRDLAARNCLVSRDLAVKISDFGLSRDMYSCDYYRVQSKSLLPVRWMPPESILYGKFTTESDVWSYGVVLWEIYSYGLQPYYGYNNQEVINMIRARKLLPCPDACPSYCYALMVECWAEQANRRPHFKEIGDRLRVWRQSGCTNGAYFKSGGAAQPTPQRHLAGSAKSSHTSDSQTLCPAEPPIGWDVGKPSSSRLHDSQSSLTSGRSSSLGNTTQSTNISGEARRERRRKSSRTADSLDRTNGKSTMVSASTSGDNFETRITE
ncbi:tyrosine-protein kinase transmembrane receptor Ror isoform X1 [Dendroctonus ponderosae]|uniref:tyrosine-protein kinase transmembrane receptor Ror isoform X1 n=1 Tax=Dendroctonus ponderosae TaxID=77166 RepID=UPI0020365FFD|nr:tyrosine-protein kinase transmembrane receptor Ror isoform X1 [Dendroctonus ponderosae]